MPEIPLPTNDISLNGLRALLRERNILAALESFHHDMGDIFQLPVRGFNPVMVAGPEANRFILVEERDSLRWRADEDPVTRLLRHGVLVEDGESHDQLRRGMNPALHYRALPRYVETMWRCADRVMDSWRTGGRAVDMLVEMRRVALLILVETLFGATFDDEMRRLWKPILRLLNYISPGPWVIWRDVPRPGYGPAIRSLDRYLHGLISARRAREGAGDDLLGLLVGSGLSDALIRDQLLTMIIAGHDTSTALLSWALYFLSSRRDVRDRATSEVDALLGKEPPTLEMAGRLPYLGQVIDETLRLYPPIHLGSRIAARDLEFQGYTIPAGRRVLYSIYLTHRDERFWPAPRRFDPERFAPGAPRPRAFTFLPFGGGPRNCIGAAFAQVEAAVVLARILQRFELDFAGRVPHAHMGATLEPRPSVRVTVRERLQPA